MTEQIFDIVYSLPTLTHSVAIATRCLTDGRQRRYPTKYTPDFGGVLDIPEFSIKNNALSSGIPFAKRPQVNITPVLKNKKIGPPLTSECLVANSYLKTICEDEFIVIRAIKNEIDFSLIKWTSDELSSESNQVTPYATIPYTDRITGIKCSDKTPDSLLIKFDKEVKTIQLNNSYSVGTTIDESVINLRTSLTRNDGYLIKDTCLNQYDNSVQAIVCDNCQNNCRLELYDISTDARTPFQTFDWVSDESKSISMQTRVGYVNNKMVGGPLIRTLVPSSTSKGVQYLEKIPNHRINYIVTTGYKTSLVDPRCNEISLVLLDKTQLMSFYPIEYCRTSNFSGLNDYQFYSLSNITVRAIDMRYPGTPMNQVNHMLESSDYGHMNLKLIKHPDDSGVETLCASSTDSICFLSFDQAQHSRFINPKSLHQPYHDTVFNRATGASVKLMHGLDVMNRNSSRNEESSFSVFQLNNNCDLYRREFSFSQNCNEDPTKDTVPSIDLFARLHPISNTNFEGLLRVEEDGRGLSPKVTKSKPKPPTLNILDEDEFQEENLPSHAASLRFEAMMKKLGRT